MVDPDARFEALVGHLQGEWYRLTPQRIALLRLLAAGDDHPSASDLYHQLQHRFPTTSPATIYKTLNLRVDRDCSRCNPRSATTPSGPWGGPLSA